jgi:hypothetical protein
MKICFKEGNVECVVTLGIPPKISILVWVDGELRIAKHVKTSPRLTIQNLNRKTILKNRKFIERHGTNYVEVNKKPDKLL